MRPPRPKAAKKKKKAKAKPAATEGPSAMEEGETLKTTAPAVWRPGQDPIEEGETLDYDPSAYDCLHALSLEYPSLSFDTIPDGMGAPRSAFPHSLYFVAATQADTPRANYVAFIRVNNLTQGKHGKKAEEEDEDDGMSDSDDDDEGPPVMHVRTLSTSRGSNRIRTMPQKPGVVAAWEDSGLVKIYDGTPQLEDLAGLDPEAEASRSKVSRPQPLFSHTHSTEGFALDWARTTVGRLASGDNNSRLHVWDPTPAGSWTVSSPFKGHTSSVEDIQWSPVEETVLASCSADKTIRVWDTRTRGKPMLTVAAHDADVNVISWNRDTSYMLASGGDEGALRVWDLRSFTKGSPVADFSHHKAPITSVEWCPNEASMLATTGADNQLCVWDLALERDPEEEMNLADGGNAEAPEDLPPQLLFIHGGQADLKEVHWHAQIPGMLISTAADGFNIFKPNNVG